MSDNDSIKKQELQKLKESSFFDKEKLPEVKKKIDQLLEELDKELAENRKIIAENDRKIMEMVNYSHTQYLRVIQLI